MDLEPEFVSLGADGEHSDISKLIELSQNDMADQKVNSSPKRLGVADISSGSGLVDLEPEVVSSGADGATPQVTNYGMDGALAVAIFQEVEGAMTNEYAENMFRAMALQPFEYRFLHQPQQQQFLHQPLQQQFLHPPQQQQCLHPPQQQQFLHPPLQQQFLHHPLQQQFLPQPQQQQFLPQPQQPRKPTKPCRFAYANLRCPHKHCRFAHGDEELHPPNETEPCEAFRAGYCKFGDNCVFPH